MAKPHRKSRIDTERSEQRDTYSWPSFSNELVLHKQEHGDGDETPRAGERRLLILGASSRLWLYFIEFNSITDKHYLSNPSTMHFSQAHIAFVALSALPTLSLALVTLSTSVHTCYKSLGKTCQTSTIVQPDCDGVIADICNQGKTAVPGSVLYNTTMSCVGMMNVGAIANMPYDVCETAFQAITKGCMLSGGQDFAANAQGGVQNMVPLTANWADWNQADTNKPAFMIQASGCV